MRIMTIVGIRPDFIRMSLVIKGLDEAKDIEHILIHAGQHYSYTMDKIFFEELGIRKPDHNMGIGSGTHAEQTGRLLVETEKMINKIQPDICVYLGDSNTSLSAVAAAKMDIRVAHIEAGMRSFDWRMPEEKNRTIVDHLSDYLYAYTQRYSDNLLYEGILTQKIRVVGNPIVDIVQQYLPVAASRSAILKTLGLQKQQYILVTAHRAENVDYKEPLSNILKGLSLVGQNVKVPVVYPMYYRTQKRVKDMHLELPHGVTVLEPLGFLDFLWLEANALCLVSDSGTVQEEGCILRVPCVTIRISTERPETIEVGANVLSGLKPEHILECVQRMVAIDRNWENPLGDGQASRRIVDDLVANRDQIMNKSFVIPPLDKRRQICFSPYLTIQ
jgi:UDP-N-acetylglucosamine 2-epimerase (non-hydrolysing)